MITEYSSYGAVRAVLGVSPREIEDTVIDLPMYEVLLLEDFLDMSSTMAADYATAKNAVSPTAIETRFVRILQTYASYQVASTLLGSVSMFAPKDITDGKASLARVADPYAALKENVAQSLGYVRQRLLAAYEAYSPANVAPAAVRRSWVVGVGLANDPVAG